jgi:hypothetical protein
MKKLIISIGVVMAALAITAVAFAGEYCPPKPPPLPDPIDYPVSCGDQKDPAVVAALTNPNYGFVNNGGLYSNDVPAAQAQTFAELVQPTNPTLISWHADTTQGHFDLAGWLRIASCMAAYVAPDAHVAVCTSKPMMRADGTMGTFFDVLQKQAVDTSPDNPYSVLNGNARYANWSSGHGLTCDDPAVKYGQKFTGKLVDGDGSVNADSDDAPGQEQWRANRYMLYA